MPAETASDSGLLAALGVALALGLLVGLEREWSKDRVAGIRTFALVTLSGALAAFLGRSFGGWVVAAAIVGLTVMILVGNLPLLKRGQPDLGLTTEFAMIVMFFTGMLTVTGQTIVAVVVAGVVMVLLQGKKPLHHMVHRIGADDLKAIARLVLIGLVILPLLPNRSYGPFGVLNPFAIWLMVVLIVGLSLAAYLVGKFMGPRQGLLSAGILGGMISSTATTVSAARRGAKVAALAANEGIVILIASATVFVRVLGEILVVTPKSAPGMMPPLALMMVWMIAVTAGCWLLLRNRLGSHAEQSPPSEMKGAIFFGLLYALVLLAVAVAKERFGQAGLYAVAAISGLTDMDAITLSTSKLVDGGQLESATGWRVILVGGMANLVFKGALAAALGGRALGRIVAAGFAASLAGAGLILAFWER